MRVLILTSVFLFGNRLGNFLRTKGIDAIVYNFGFKFYDEVKSLLNEADMFILDLPADRLENVLQKIREVEHSKPIIVFGTTGKNIIDILKFGIYKFMEKPIDPEILVKYIREYEFRDQVKNRAYEKNFALYTRNLNDVLIVTVLGYLQPDVVEEIKKVIGNSKKVVVSLNGVSTLNLDLSVLKNFKDLLESSDVSFRFVVVRERIKNFLVEEGVNESLIFSNEFLAVKSFT